MVVPGHAPYMDLVVRDRWGYGLHRSVCTLHGGWLMGDRFEGAFKGMRGDVFTYKGTPTCLYNILLKSLKISEFLYLLIVCSVVKVHFSCIQYKPGWLGKNNFKDCLEESEIPVISEH